MMIRIAKRFPFVLATLLGLLLSALVSYMGVQYDSGGVGSLFFYLGMVLQFPVWIAHEVIYALPAVKAVNYNNILVIAGGLGIALVFDLTLSALLSRRRNRAKY